VELLAPRPGERWADLGCGSGFFTFALSARVGEEGLVYAIDIAAEALRAVEEEAERRGVRNVRLVLSADWEIPLPEGAVDGVLLVDVLSEADDPGLLLEEARRITRSGGKLLVVDWRRDAPHPPGPPPAERLTPAALRELCASSGWVAGRREEAGPYHFAALFTAGDPVPRPSTLDW
jgi:ubiquinone/menaquinone biosynthesis C-methylase UbiE